MNRRSKIVGTGMYVPDRVITNDDMTQWMETSDEWIQKRSGIKERRWCEEGTAPSELAENAVRRALDEAGLEPTDLDCIILATLSAEADFPGTSYFLQERLGLEDTPCFDLRAQCSGFLFSLNVANSFIRSGQFDRVVVVGCEIHSTGIDISNEGRDVAVLFGDGSGAVIVEANTDESDDAGILECRMHSEGKYAKKLWLEGPSSAHYPTRMTHQLIDEGRIWPKMEGRFVFKNAVTRMPQVLHEALNAASLKLDDIDWFLFHQANLRINEFVAKSLELPPEKCPSNIQKYGNCSAASIPMLLDELRKDGRAKPGQLVTMTGFGSGFTWGSTVVRL
ncbi:MAG: ketoacyl-ACP synthase III [Deltaproteobacteria bacterium]|nr:ketoacyl-ACP synthase III [Deltaproteobacteria bacterium]